MNQTAPTIAATCIFPVSASQRGLWLLEKLDGPNSAYNIPATLRIEGKLMPGILKKSLRDLAARHEALRTAITEVDGEPQQTVYDAVEVEFSERYLNSVEALEPTLLTDAGKPFLLSEAPLWRVRLLHIFDDNHVLQINLHHAIADGYSLIVLLRDLVCFYNARLKGQAPGLPELPIQFADYACWEESRFRSLPEDAIAYWKKKLAALPALELPGSFPRPDTFSYKGRILASELKQNHVIDLESQALKSGINPFQAYLGLLQIILLRWTGQDDVPLGIPVANRDRPEFKNMSGFLTNTLVVRNKVVTGDSFLEHCGKLASSFKDDLQYADIPFELLTREILESRDPSKNPFFQIMFAFQQEPEALPVFDGAKTSIIDLPLDVAHFDLRVEIVCRKNSRILNVEFATDILPEDSVRHLISIFNSTLEEFAEKPTAGIGSLTETMPDIPMPLSSHQERIWFIDSFETGNVYPSHPVYHNMPVILEGKRWIPEVVTEAANRLLERHEGVRSRARLTQEGAILEIRASAQVTVDRISIRENDDTAVESLISYAFQPLDLESDILFRVGIGKSADGVKHLVIVSHQLVADRRSLQLLANEFKQAYAAILANRDYTFSSKSTPLREVLYNERQKQDQAYDQHLDYWISELALPLPALELPYDFPRHPVHLYEPGRHTISLNAALRNKLREIGNTVGCSLEPVLLSAFQVLLHYYSGQDDIVVGIPEPAESDAVAPLSNLMVCRQGISGDSAFTAHLEDVHNHLAGMRKHGGVSFDRLVQAINPPKDMSRTALFDVLFEWATLNPETREFNIGYGKYDLHALFSDSEAGIQVCLAFNRCLFRDRTIQRMFHHFGILLNGIAENPEKNLSEFDLLTPREQATQIHDWNNTDAGFPVGASIHQLFEEQVRRTPDHTAIRDNDEELTYKQLNNRANILASHLIGLDPETDELVGICMGKSAACVVAMLGVLKTGVAYLPLDPSLPEKRLQWILEDAGTRIVIADESRLSHLDVPIKIDYGTLDFEDHVQENPGQVVESSQLAYCIYTSGSTGKPKGVLVEHEQVVRLLINDRNPFDFKSSDIWTFFHSPGFDFSVWEIYGALLYGGKLVVVPKCVSEDSSQFAAFLVKEEVTVLNQTPTSFYYLANEFLEIPRQHSLHTIIFGGETLSPLRIKDFHSTYPEVKLMNMFGITETTVHVTRKVLQGEDFERNLNLIGKPIPTTTCYVLDKKGKLLPPGIPGEIHVGGKGVARGYLNRSELTSTRFIPNPFEPGSRLYRSGDKGYALENGELVHLGRLDLQVQIRGFRVEIGEVQAKLLQHPDIRDALVITRELITDGTRILLAYVVPQTGAEMPEFEDYLSDSLPHYMIPSRFIAIDEIPLTSNGKADIASLPDPEQQAKDEHYDRGPVFLKIEDIWKKLLAVDNISPDDDFFQLGGYSLLATRMLALLERELECKMPLRTLFDSPTLEAFSNQVIESLPSGQLPVEPATGSDTSILSSTQKRLWFIDRLEGQSIAYHLFGVVDLDEQPDLTALRSALKHLTRIHPALRMGFPETNGEPYVQLLETVSLPLEIENLSVLPEDQQESAFAGQAREFSRKPFDLSNAPLARVRLFRLSSGAAKLVVGLHHIIADGWSLNLLMRDLHAAYNGFRNGSPLIIEIQSAIYSQPSELPQSRKQELLQFWQQRLENVENLQLPTDFPRPPLATAEGAQLAFTINSEIAGKLERFCNHSGYTPFMVCLGVFSLILARKARQTEFAVGIPLANRDDPNSHATVGCFVNTLPAVVQVDEELPFIKLLEQIRNTTLEIHENQQLPFDQLVEAVNPERDMSMHPLYQVIFNYQEALFRDDAGQEPRITPIDTGAAQVDLALYLDKQSDALNAFLVYRTSLFSPIGMDRFTTRFIKTLMHCLDQAENSLMSHGLLAASDRKLLSQWNDTAQPWNEPVLLHKLVEATVHRQPEKKAVEIDGRSINYRELDCFANELAAKLINNHGMPDYFTVAICYERSFEMVVSMLAILKAGGAYLPIDPGLPAERISKMLRIAGAELLITSPDLAGPMAAQTVKQLVYMVPETVPTAMLLAPDISPGDPAYVIFTSGSTGEPKGVVNTHEAICNRLLWMRDYLSIDPQADIILQKTPYTFDVSLWDIFLPLVAGVELVLARPGGHMDPSYLVEEINHRGITTLHFVPSMLQAFLLHPEVSTCNSLKHVVCSGEALPYSLAETIHHLLPGSNLYNLYGPTEAAVDVTEWKCMPGDKSDPIPIGRPIANIKIRILDRFFRDVPVNDHGEICIEGIGLAKGYCNNRDLTDAVFVSDPENPAQRLYKTGDLGRFRSDGLVEFHGRIDNQVKIRGLRVEPEEVDVVLRSLPGIQEAATVVPAGKEVLHSYVVLDPQQSNRISLTAIKDSLKKELPEYLVPTHIVQLKQFPLSRHGKIDRKKLSRMKVEHTVTESGFLDQWEHIVADVWRNLLETDAFNRNDKFFDVGGHSLLLIKAHLELQKRTGGSFELIELFRYPTIASLAEFLRGAMDSDSVSLQQSSKPAWPDQTEIAVIGMAGRFPGAANLKEFGKMVLQGVPAIRFFSEEELKSAGADERIIKDPAFVPAFGALEDIDLFDAGYFSFSPAEAARLDPQVRIFLTCAEEALQHAGIIPDCPESTIGVFAGSSVSTYGLMQLTADSAHLDPDTFSTMLANDKDYLATRVAYKLGLQGPAMSVQTGCSTSLSSVHVACQSLLYGECNMAIAGGVSLQSGIPPGYYYQQDGILSPDGHCRAFSKDAAGTVQGSGCGVVVLKPLERAMKDGDPVLAVIKGSAMNNDGSDKVGFTAPSVQGQQKVIRSAMEKAGIGPDAVSYIETHGTGTPLGDMIEVSALKSVFARADDHQCVLGSVKAQIGHLDAAAGIAGLIKTILCLNEKKLPPTLYADSPNPRLGLDDSPFELNPEVREWVPGIGQRIAGVSSFGIGGTNVHVIVREWAETDTGPDPQEPVVIVLSAATDSGLELRKQWLFENCDAGISLPALAWTLQSGRKHLRIRAAYIAMNHDDLKRQLQGQPPICSVDSISFQNLTKICDSWLRGYDVSWKSLYPSKPLRRVALPPFPFELKRFWALDGVDQKNKERGRDAGSEISIYTQSFKSVHLKANPGNLSLLVSDQADTGIIQSMASSFSRFHTIGTEDFLDGRSSLSESESEFENVMILLDDQTPGDSYAKVLVQVQKLVAAAPLWRLRRLMFVATGHGGLDPNVRQYLLESFVIVLRQEFPALDIRLLQTDILDKSSLECALNILHADSIPYPVLKNVGSSLLVPHFGRTELEKRESVSTLRTGGSYLITGASGGIARFLARHLAVHYKANLYLSARKEVDSTLIKELEQCGSTVYSLKLDVVDEQSVASAFEKITDIEGIFHLAGISGDSAILSIEDVSEAGAFRILAPKTIGTVNLLRAAGARHCRFFVGFSSISTILGGLGFGAYAAANASMDALLEQYNISGEIDCYSLGWDGWRLNRDILPNSIKPSDALKAMEAILDSGQKGRYFVASSQIEKRIKDWVFMKESVPYVQPVKPYTQSEEGIKQELTSIWKELLAVDHASETDDFISLGGDSLLALQMLTMITNRFSVKVGIRDIMEATTLGELATLVWQRHEANTETREVGEI
ncbi:MAG: amino acid adenylation domain-containing protein [Deltaproteobacteria bacterium]|jgi:amino acid adenylation domain-containing protein|nr:amino acid adenylation domain-containing protein [Deltaproteobacteria bacterium]